MATYGEPRFRRAVYRRLAERHPDAAKAATRRKRAERWSAFLRSGIWGAFGLVAGPILLVLFTRNLVSDLGESAATGWFGLVHLTCCGLLAGGFVNSNKYESWSGPLSYTPASTSIVRGLIYREWTRLVVVHFSVIGISLAVFASSHSDNVPRILIAFACSGLLLPSVAFLWIRWPFRGRLFSTPLVLLILIVFYAAFGSDYGPIQKLAQYLGEFVATYLPLAWPARILSDSGQLWPLIMITAGASILASIAFRRWAADFEFAPLFEEDSHYHWEIAKEADSGTNTNLGVPGTMPVSDEDRDKARKDVQKALSTSTTSFKGIENRYWQWLTSDQRRLASQLLGLPGPWTLSWWLSAKWIACATALIALSRALGIPYTGLLISFLVSVKVITQLIVITQPAPALRQEVSGSQLIGPLHRFVPVSLIELFIVKWKSVIVRVSASMPWLFCVILFWQISGDNDRPLLAGELAWQVACLTVAFASWIALVLPMTFASHLCSDTRLTSPFAQGTLKLVLIVSYVGIALEGFALLLFAALPWENMNPPKDHLLSALAVGLFALAHVFAGYRLPLAILRWLQRRRHEWAPKV